MHAEPSGGAGPRPGVRPALDVPHLAAWWVLAAGLVATMIFVLTDHMLRATTTLGGALAVAAGLRLILASTRAGGLVVRSPWVDALTLLLLAAAVLGCGFTLDLTAR